MDGTILIKLKADIFDIIAQQDQLKLANAQLEQKKQELLKQLAEAQQG